MSQNFNDLAKRISSGDQVAENELFQLFQDEIRMIVDMRIRVSMSNDDRQDLISEVFESVLVQLRKGAYDPSSGKSLGAYVSGVARNVIGMYFRKKKVRLEAASRIQAESSSKSEASSLTDLINSERGKLIMENIRKLKPKYSQVLLMKFYDKLSNEEIAEMLSLTPQKVSERSYYAIKLLLEQFKKSKNIFISFLLAQIGLCSFGLAAIVAGREAH